MTIFPQYLDKSLSRTVYLVGCQLTLADIMLYYALHPLMLELSIQEKEQFINLSRWFHQVNIACSSLNYLTPWSSSYYFFFLSNVIFYAQYKWNKEFKTEYDLTSTHATHWSPLPFSGYSWLVCPALIKCYKHMRLYLPSININAKLNTYLIMTWICQ